VLLPFLSSNFSPGYSLVNRVAEQWLASTWIFYSAIFYGLYHRVFEVYTIDWCTHQRHSLHDPSYGALTQLWAGTSPEGKDMNGKVCPASATRCCIVHSDKSWIWVISISSLGLALVRPEKTVKTPPLAKNFGLGWRSR
jgi:hypothetical protein